jgi:hypothetical protein
VVQVLSNSVAYPGSYVFFIFYPKIWDSDPGPERGKKSGSGMFISQSLATIFGLKIDQFFCQFCVESPDPGSGASGFMMEKSRSGDTSKAPII